MKSAFKRSYAVVFVLLAVAAVWPEKSNYYMATIDLVASEYSLQPDDLEMRSGEYQNLMMLRTVDIELFSWESENTIIARAQKTPFSDWHLEYYAIKD